MFRITGIVAIVVWSLWALAAFTDVAMRVGNSPLSIVSQMFFSWGLSYAVYVFILLWFLEKIGADRYMKHMEQTELHMQRVETLLLELIEAQKGRGNPDR